MENLLEEVRSAFYSYRISSGKGKHFTTELKKQAVQLLSEHSVNDVSSLLGVSVSSLKAWKKRFSVSEEDANDESPHFVSLPLFSDEEVTETSDSLRRMHVRFPCGVSLELISPHLSELSTLTELLLRGGH